MKIHDGKVNVGDFLFDFGLSESGYFIAQVMLILEEKRAIIKFLDGSSGPWNVDSKEWLYKLTKEEAIQITLGLTPPSLNIGKPYEI